MNNFILQLNYYFWMGFQLFWVHQSPIKITSCTAVMQFFISHFHDELLNVSNIFQYLLPLYDQMIQLLLLKRKKVTIHVHKKPALSHYKNMFIFSVIFYLPLKSTMCFKHQLVCSNGVFKLINIINNVSSLQTWIMCGWIIIVLCTSMGI